jgi:hypothetical protein
LIEEVAVDAIPLLGGDRPARAAFHVLNGALEFGSGDRFAVHRRHDLGQLRGHRFRRRRRLGRGARLGLSRLRGRLGTAGHGKDGNQRNHSKHGNSFVNREAVAARNQFT